MFASREPFQNKYILNRSSGALFKFTGLFYRQSSPTTLPQSFHHHCTASLPAFVFVLGRYWVIELGGVQPLSTPESEFVTRVCPGGHDWMLAGRNKITILSNSHFSHCLNHQSASWVPPNWVNVWICRSKWRWKYVVSVINHICLKT